jgi:capsid protein
MNIYMLQALALFMWKLDGIGVFQIVAKDAPYRPLSLSVLPIDPGRLVTPTDLQGSDNVYDGIELDDNGAPVAAYILKPTRYGMQYSSARMADCARIQVNNSVTGLPNLLLVCDVRNVAEYRQDSILGSMIKEIRDSNDFVDAALVKALISNLMTVFIQGYYNSSSPPDWADRIKEIEKGTILMGNEGEIPHFLSNDTPGPGYDIMNASIVGRLGMATGRGPENVSKAYTASYSASQASMENAERLNDSDRAILVNRFCQPIHALMQYEAALRGLLPVKSVDQFLANLHAYTKTEWLPPKLRPIDKLKAAKADQSRLGNMTRTWSDIYGEMSKDWRSQISQWMSEVQFALEDADLHNVPREVVLQAIGIKPQAEPQPTQDASDAQTE